MRFGGNSLFGEGIESKKNKKDNGIASRYRKLIGDKLKEESHEKGAILEAFENKSNISSQDIINFLFGIEEFSQKLMVDGDLKVLFLLHNSALLYHAAQVMKSEGFGIPKHIGLSGNGSRILEITNGSDNLNDPYRESLKDLATRIFRKVYEQEDSHTIKFVMSSAPKESTTFGGIKGFDSHMDSDKTYKINVGDGKKNYEKGEIKEYHYQDIHDDQAMLEDTEGNKVSFQKEVISNIQEFLEFFFGQLWSDSAFVDAYSVSGAIDKEVLKKYAIDESSLKDSLINALDARIGDQEKEFSETLFFDPITNMLYFLSKQLVDIQSEFKTSV